MTIIHFGKRVSLILQTKESTSGKMLLDIEGLIGTTIGLMKILNGPINLVLSVLSSSRLKFSGKWPISFFLKKTWC